jgi:hypothetical protein
MPLSLRLAYYLFAGVAIISWLVTAWYFLIVEKEYRRACGKDTTYQNL